MPRNGSSEKPISYPWKECEEAIVARGGKIKGKAGVSQETDYLVIGEEGSKAWKQDNYGRKIEAAIVSRREHGKPAIISEEHWAEALGQIQ